jgi:hypothetical protein
MNEVPEVGSKWRHAKGDIYEVAMISNGNTSDPERYPITVIYKSDSGVWSRPLSDWHRSMVLVPSKNTRIENIINTISHILGFGIFIN